MKTTGSDPAEVRATLRATKFSLAANYDPELVPQLAGYPVDEVYGKFPTDGISSGRPRRAGRFDFARVSQRGTGKI